MKVTQSCLTLQPHGLYRPWNSPGQNIGVGSLSLLQGIFPTQGLNLGLPHCRQILYQLSHQGSPSIDINQLNFTFGPTSCWVDKSFLRFPCPFPGCIQALRSSVWESYSLEVSIKIEQKDTGDHPEVASHSHEERLGVRSQSWLGMSCSCRENLNNLSIWFSWDIQRRKGNLGIPQVARVGRVYLPKDHVMHFHPLPPLRTPCIGKNSSLYQAPFCLWMWSFQHALHQAPGRDDGSIHVSFDGPGKCLGGATILVYTLPQSGIGPSICSYSVLYFHTTSASDGPRLCVPGSPLYLCEPFHTQILTWILQRCCVQLLIPFT